MANIIAGTSGADALNGLSGDNSISGGAGADKINGGAGVDTMDGGAGNDTVSGNSGDDVLIYRVSENVGSMDIYDGGSGKDVLRLEMTLSDWLKPAFQADLANYQAFLDANTNWRTLEATNATFKFTAFGLAVSKLESIDIWVGGAHLTAEDSAVTLGDDTMSATEDASGLSLNLLGNDSVPDQVLTLTATNGAHGTVTVVNPDFSVVNDPKAFATYAPNSAYWNFLAVGESGTDSFTYTVTDADGDTKTASVLVTIHGVNDSVAITSGVQAGAVVEDAQDTPAPGDSTQATGVITFTDPDLTDVHTASVTATPAGALGSLSLGSVSEAANTEAGSVGWTYTLNAGAANHLAQGVTVTETWTVTVQDAHGSSKTQDVVITVTGTNDGPVAHDDTGAGTENQTLTLDVLANDTDLDDGHVFTLLGGSAPKGSVSVDANKLVFNPGADFDHLAQGATEQVTVTYDMKDEFGAASSASVVITVTGTNDAPVLTPVNVSADRDETDAGLTAHGSVTVQDLDVGDVVTLSVDSVSVGGAGSTSVSPSDLKAMMTVEQNGAWHFNSGGEAFDNLPAGQTLVLTYTLKADDGHVGGTDTQDVVITITGTNDAAVIGAPSAADVTEGGPVNGLGQLTATGAIPVTDADDGEAGFQVAVSGAAGNLGSLTLAADGSYAYAVADAATQGLGANQTHVDKFTVTAIDGATKEVAFTIHGVNDAPAFTSGATGGVAENSAASTVVYDASVTDVDGAAATFSLGGADKDLFNIDATTGQVTFKVSPNYEAPGDADANNVYDIVVNAFDGTDTTGKNVSISVSNVNEAPSITSNGGGDTATVAVPEGTSAVTTVAAADPDGGTSFTYSLVGGADQLKFAIDSAGHLTFVSPPDFEAPTDTPPTNSYQVVVRVSDGALFDDQAITVNVTDVAEAPPNAAPVANADKVIMSANTSPAYFLASSLLKNDTDPDNDALHVVGVTGPGATFDAGTGFITLTDPSITSFTYQVMDTANNTASATVTVAKQLIGNGNAADTVDLSTDTTYVASYIDAGNGNDMVTGGGGTDWFLGGPGADVLVGGDANDTINGLSDADRINGSGGDDSLLGDAGADTLTGGAGNDVLDGGAGADVFVFTSLNDGADTIVGFTDGGGNPDRIDLSAIDAIPGGADNAFTFVAGQTAATVANSVTWQFNGSDTIVRIDTNGQPGAELTIVLSGQHSLTSGNFIL